MKGISKSFGGNVVLSGVDLEVRPGEVHALVGENGAGKSTLMKILSGVCPRDSGTILLGGREIDLPNPSAARRAGISMIYQEHTLAPHLTVAANIFLGVEMPGRYRMLNDAGMERHARSILERHGFPIDPSAVVARLTRAEKQLVEIARALHHATRVVIMDEPTAMLSSRESCELFQVIGELKARGLGIVYISHRIEELQKIADRVTILRDGRRVFSGEFGSIDGTALIRYMAGHEVNGLYPARGQPGDEAVLEVRDFGDDARYRNVTFTLHRGEILGMAGLVGAGRTSLARALFGLERRKRGVLSLRGSRVEFRTCGDAIHAGIAYLAEDRNVTGLFPHLPVVHNVSISSLLTRLGTLRLGEMARRCRELMDSLHVVARSESQPIRLLSGGNQQKSLIARWIFAESSILVLDEPTQGVDVAARADIYRCIRDLAARGAAILIISSDLPELLGMSHRIAVMRRGEIAATLETASTSQEEIMRHATLVQ